MAAAGSPFDRIQSSMFNVITSQFGYRAEWRPTAPDGATLQTTKVLYKEPTKVFDMMTVDFQITDESMEYKQGVFVDLFRMANMSNSAERVTIYFKDAPRDYYIRKVIKKYDGQTYVAKLEPADD